MKTIAQLLQLRTNKYYKFTPEEQKVLDDFLSTQSEDNQLNKNSKDLETNTHAIVLSKNIVPKDVGVIPTE